MGYQQHKYTRTYFTKRDESGQEVEYGVEGFDEFLHGSIRDIDLGILRRIDFAGKRVLELGFGRGEVIKYTHEQGAAYYEGVDFAEAAVEIARDFLVRHNIPTPPLHWADALEFLRGQAATTGKEPYDVAVMLDFVEHVPRHELREILTLLKGLLSPLAVVVVNTPAYRVDNDVIADGLDTRNHEEALDTADFIEATSGMHCNKYTSLSLREFFSECDYEALTEAHYYIPRGEPLQAPVPVVPYRERWLRAVAEGRPVRGEYLEDVIEYAFRRTFVPKWQTFQEGSLAGATMFLADEYLQYFPGGNYDEEIFSHLRESGPSGRTIFDIGGFMGVSSIQFARLVGPSGRVVCFEPNPWNQNRICLNLSRNPEPAAIISLYGLALSDREEELEMLLTDSLDNGHSSTSQLREAHGVMPRERLLELGFTSCRIPGLTLDGFVERTGILPDILKIDVEGAEHLVLVGALETIHEHRPMIYLELHSPLCAMLCTRFLLDAAYELTLLLEETDGRLIIHAAPGNRRQPLQTGRESSDFQVDSLVAQRKALQDQLASLRWYMTEMEGEKKKLSALYQSLSSRHEELSSQFEPTRIEAERLRQELAASKDNLAALQSIVDHPIVRVQKSLWRALRKALKG